MGPLDALWHLAGLFGPALGVGLIAPLLAKLLWRRELRGLPWLALARWTVSAAALVVVAGLLLLGRDGRMVTYGALVAMSALVLWWRGWLRR
jgi:hypothetical protein